MIRVRGRGRGREGDFMTKEKRILKEAVKKSDRLMCVDFEAQWEGGGWFDILILTKMHYKVIIDIAKHIYFIVLI